MFCKNCGKELNEGTAFCTSCGAQVNQTSFETTANAFVSNAKAKIDSSGFKKYLTKKNIIIVVAVFVVLCIIGAALGDDSAVSIVKNGHFYFDKSKTVGELLYANFDDVEWESLVAADGKTYVNATMNIDGVTFLIQFKVNENNKNFNVNACEINGIPVSISDLF